MIEDLDSKVKPLPWRSRGVNVIHSGGGWVDGTGGEYVFVVPDVLFCDAGYYNKALEVYLCVGRGKCRIRRGMRICMVFIESVMCG